MLLRPAEITAQRFSRKLFGANTREVFQFLAEIAAAADRMNEEMSRIILERDAAQSLLKTTRGEVERLEHQVAALQERLARYQEREHVIAETLLVAQETHREVIARGRSEAEATIRSAKITAGEIVQSSHRAAAGALRDAKRIGEEAIQSADRAAAARVSLAQGESLELTENARKVATQIELLTRQHADALVARIEAILSQDESISHPSDQANKWYSESLAAIKKLRADLRTSILPNARKGCD